jgi:hypothetical protein
VEINDAHDGNPAAANGARIRGDDEDDDRLAVAFLNAGNNELFI